MIDSLQSYGFEYEYEGHRFAFDVPAESEEEARGRAAAMSGAVFVGRLIPAQANDSDQRAGKERNDH